MKKEIGVRKVGMLLSLFNQASTIEQCIQSLQQQRTLVMGKIQDACVLLEIPADKLTVNLVEGTVEWPDPPNVEEDRQT